MESFAERMRRAEEIEAETSDPDEWGEFASIYEIVQKFASLRQER